MKEIFSKINFLPSPGGNIYHWKEADTFFKIQNNGQFVIKITSSAKNAKQNRSTDDDDLRLIIDDYEFGKYEVHEEKVSWKGFGTASSWDGASLKGSTKTIYFFLKLQKGKHKIKFFADGTPTLKEIKIFQINKGEQFQVKELQPPQGFKVDKNGIPWMSFVFLGVKPKNFFIASACKSAKQKGSTDGDNLKIIINGKILQNKKTSTSKKYKNFYFSGDLNKGKSEFLEFNPKDFEFLEDSVEFWYDENPNIYISIELFNDVKNWLQNGITEKAKLRFYEFILQALVKSFSLARRKYTSEFLKHSLSENPNKLIFDNNSPLVSKIRKDKAYKNLLNIVIKEIENGIFTGQVHLGDESQGLNIEFRNGDLKYSLHGLKKIEYKASPRGNDTYNINLNIFDVYDFDPKDYELSPTWVVVHIANILETETLLQNFEIEINIQDIIKVNDV